MAVAKASLALLRETAERRCLEGACEVLEVQRLDQVMLEPGARRALAIGVLTVAGERDELQRAGSVRFGL